MEFIPIKNADEFDEWHKSWVEYGCRKIDPNFVPKEFPLYLYVVPTQERKDRWVEYLYCAQLKEMLLNLSIKG